ncbi:uncharacterized protein LOC125946356 [Dermacentor silvarum]|uniref:uncharacterized protein LOC125946356 n=1 Tax=Dermacentor silvarum TaxID=543639 RepID=UPI00210144C3|nr:uncharacterized protein LOC125946356 [Dermacentor silvarum]
MNINEGVKRGAACIFIAISCAAIAVSALVIYDVIKIGKSTNDKADLLKRTTAQASGTYPETRQFSRATESTAAKVTIPKRPELPRQTTSGGDLLETETAVTNGTTDRGATGIGSANGLVERTKKVSHEDVTRLFSKADDQTTSEGHFQEASVDNVTDIQNATGLNREVFVSASSLSYGTSDTNKTFSGETDAGMSRNVSISVSVIGEVSSIC